MLDQNDMDKLSRLTENDFRAILTAVEGGVDYEFMIMLLEGYYFDRALKMCKEGWPDAADRYQDKAEKVRNFRMRLSKLNA